MRKVLFWTHLVAGLVAGLVILVMSFTGAVLAFEHEIVEWAERDVRRVAVPADPAAARLSLDDLTARVRAAHPEARPASVTVSADPADAVAFSLGRDATVYADPYTGELRSPAGTRTHDFMHLMVDWHRYLAQSGDNRATGKAITGASNAAFVVLAVTGLILWWPRTWRWMAARASLVFTGAKGKARDWNWHNVFGFWMLIPIFVMAVSGMVISYRWAGNLVYRAVGEAPPVQAGPGAPAAGPAAPTITRPSPDARPAGYDALLATVTTATPGWEQVSFRTGGAQRGARPPAAGTSAPAAADSSAPVGLIADLARPPGASAPASATTAAGEVAASAEARPARARDDNTSGGASATSPRAGRAASGEGGGPAGPQPITATVRTPDRWPRTATTTLTLHPFTAEVLTQTGFADLSTGRQARSWLRFLHTGQALGWPGQLIGGVGCLAGCFLVYTGFALSWRRFFGRRSSAAPVAAAARPSAHSVS